VLNAPAISDVYKHYRGENLLDRKFFENALTESFKVPAEKISEFIDIFIETLETAKLIEKIGEKYRVIDISSESNSPLVDTKSEIKKLSKAAGVSSPKSRPLGLEKNL